MLCIKKIIIFPLKYHRKRRGFSFIFQGPMANGQLRYTNKQINKYTLNDQGPTANRQLHAIYQLVIFFSQSPQSSQRIFFIFQKPTANGQLLYTNKQINKYTLNYQ